MITSVNSTSDSIKARPKNQRQLDGRTGSRVARHGFAGGATDSALAERGQSGGNGHAESGSYGDPIGRLSRGASALRVRRHRHKHQGDQRKEYHHQFLHFFLLMNRCQWVVDVHRADALTLTANL